ncbi:MAG: Eco57I restriction-modification methylase domain-containing protein, partial [Alphaproteobacteria bacterium]|nr:Eco57I restriction-modification methylase domain-containing protein [Alphaproteobacteria bacterium]
MNDVLNEVYNPDVLECIANLSNDEVFTPPEVANAMLDLLPQELFSNPNTKFLDPACKSGVFLREIAKRLLVGLEKEYPDLQSRVNHIFKNQLYGIAITELTSLLSRRSVYCCKYADNKYSVTKFDTLQGNIFFEEGKHLFVGGKCLHCGIGEQSFKEQFTDKEEKHAYQFIHNLMPGELENMKFDVIIGNPPYQMNDGGNAASATPIYQHFVEQAQKLNPKYMSFIIPARWYAGGKGLDQFREKMLNDRRISNLVDYKNTEDCFPGVNVAGGVCYFLWQQNYSDSCIVDNFQGTNIISSRKRNLNEFSTFIRDNKALDIIHKIGLSKENCFSNMVYTRNSFSLPSNERGHKEKRDNDYSFLSSEGKSFISATSINDKNKIIDKYKVIITYAMSGGNKPGSDNKYQIVSSLLVLNPNEVCTETYLILGTFEKKEEANNLVTYVKTKSFRFLLLQALSSIHITKQTFQFVPLQDFSKPWTDAELYEKYNLSQE